MHFVDWVIVFLPLILVGYVAMKAQRYVKGVSDFLAAGRVAGRYVVAVASVGPWTWAQPPLLPSTAAICTVATVGAVAKAVLKA